MSGAGGRPKPKHFKRVMRNAPLAAGDTSDPPVPTAAAASDPAPAAEAVDAEAAPAAVAAAAVESPRPRPSVAARVPSSSE